MSEIKYTITVGGNINHGLNSRPSLHHSSKEYLWLEAKPKSNNIRTNPWRKNFEKGSHSKLSIWIRWKFEVRKTKLIAHQWKPLLTSVSARYLPLRTSAKQGLYLHTTIKRIPYLDLIASIEQAALKIPKAWGNELKLKVTQAQEKSNLQRQTTHRRKDWPWNHYRVIKTS